MNFCSGLSIKNTTRSTTERTVFLDTTAGGGQGLKFQPVNSSSRGPA